MRAAIAMPATATDVIAIALRRIKRAEGQAAMASEARQMLFSLAGIIASEAGPATACAVLESAIAATRLRGCGRARRQRRAH
jgi:hypothetical protein